MKTPRNRLFSSAPGGRDELFLQAFLAPVWVVGTVASNSSSRFSSACRHGWENSSEVRMHSKTYLLDRACPFAWDIVTKGLDNILVETYCFAGGGPREEAVGWEIVKSNTFPGAMARSWGGSNGFGGGGIGNSCGPVSNKARA